MHSVFKGSILRIFFFCRLESGIWGMCRVFPLREDLMSFMVYLMHRMKAVHLTIVLRKIGFYHGMVTFSPPFLPPSLPSLLPPSLFILSLFHSFSSLPSSFPAFLSLPLPPSPFPLSLSSLPFLSPSLFLLFSYSNCFSLYSTGPVSHSIIILRLLSNPSIWTLSPRVTT